MRRLSIPTSRRTRTNPNHFFQRAAMLDARYEPMKTVICPAQISKQAPTTGVFRQERAQLHWVYFFFVTRERMKSMQLLAR